MTTTKKRPPNKIWIIMDEISSEVWDGEGWTDDEKMALVYTTKKKVETAFHKGPNKKLGAVIAELGLS